MKVLIYGASVTAQKGDSGYYQHLKNLSSFDVSRMPFGASHLQFAGLAMLGKVIAEKPDVCVLDWATPSTKSFPSNIVERINRTLIQNDILPIWVLFPRTDDTYCNRVCCEQIKAQASELVCVKNFVESDFCKDVDLKFILRDVVHTNEIGAKLYARFVHEILEEFYLDKFNKIDLSRYGVNSVKEVIPFILEWKITISKNSDAKIKLIVNNKCDLNVFIFCQIGPSSPVLNVRLKRNETVASEFQCNVVDPWCYYKRDMLVNLPAINDIDIGEYEIVFSISDAEPFENINTLQPINDSDLLNVADRYLNVYEVSIDGDVILEEINEL